MIAFVKVSPRRHIAIDTPKRESAWRSLTLSAPTSAHPETQGIIYATATLIAGPKDWPTVERAAVEYVTANRDDKLWTYREWQQEQQRRADYLKRMNAEITARGQGLGAVLGTLTEDQDSKEARDLLHRALPLLVELGNHIGNGAVDPDRPDSHGVRCDLIGDIKDLLEG